MVYASLIDLHRAVSTAWVKRLETCKMDLKKPELLLCNAIKGFHGRFKKMYGQICIRVDDRVYLSTGGNKVLSEIGIESFELCDISTGDIGRIFRSRPDINGIIFACSPDTVKASASGENVRTALEDLAMLTGPELQVIPDTSPSAILSALDRSSVCLIKGVGALAAGSNLKKAVAGIQIVEKACEAENHGRLIGGTVPIKTEWAEEYRRRFVSDYTNRNEGVNADYIGFNERELDLRAKLVDFGKDLVRHDLSYGSWGNLSVRLNDDEMLITPSSMDYFEIKIEDIVKVNIRTLEYGSQRMPSSEVRMHAEAYKELPDCGAIIHTRSNGISVFAACEAGFRLGKGDLQSLIGDVKATAYAPAGTEELARAAVKTLGETHACIIPHHGGVFYGPSLDVVFAIAEAVEMRARNILDFDAPLTSETEE